MSKQKWKCIRKDEESFEQIEEYECRISDLRLRIRYTPHGCMTKWAASVYSPNHFYCNYAVARISTLETREEAEEAAIALGQFWTAFKAAHQNDEDFEIPEEEERTEPNMKYLTKFVVDAEKEFEFDDTSKSEIVITCKTNEETKTIKTFKLDEGKVWKRLETYKVAQKFFQDLFKQEMDLV